MADRTAEGEELFVGWDEHELYRNVLQIMEDAAEAIEWAESRAALRIELDYSAGDPITG